MTGGDDTPRYDRDFLLSPAKRNQIIELWEVEKFGRDSFGDPNAASLYGMTPAQWYARGVRILARTTLEAVRDPLGNRIGEDVARVAATALAFTIENCSITRIDRIERPGMGHGWRVVRVNQPPR